MTRLLFSFRLFTSESMRFSADVAAAAAPPPACTVTMVTVAFVGWSWGCGTTVVFCWICLSGVVVVVVLGDFFLVDFTFFLFEY